MLIAAVTSRRVLSRLTLGHAIPRHQTYHHSQEIPLTDSRPPTPAQPNSAPSFASDTNPFPHLHDAGHGKAKTVAEKAADMIRELTKGGGAGDDHARIDLRRWGENQCRKVAEEMRK
ncbi:hypothetical protein HKX48_009197 [Thoreauomyces humboldtii]|nr:hypothetical protein HKX48_009197 [Thoreauomyces humboldtii]